MSGTKQVLSQSAAPTTLKPGFQVMRPLLINEGGKQFVEKVIGLADGDVFTEQVARQLAHDITAYHQELTKLGVNVPSTLDVSIRQHDALRWVVVEHAEYRGIDIEELILSADADTCVTLTKGILDNVAKLFSASDLSLYDAGSTLDPKPVNWTWDKTHGVSYVDFVPPRFREPNDILLEYPRGAALSAKDWQFLYSRYFDRRGLVHILFVQLCRIRPELRVNFFNAITTFLDNIGDTRVKQFMHELPSQEVIRLRDAGELARAAEVIQALGPDSADDFRDIGLALVNGHRHVLAGIFRLSHVDMGGCLEKHKVESLRSLLKALLLRENGDG